MALTIYRESFNPLFFESGSHDPKPTTGNMMLSNSVLSVTRAEFSLSEVSVDVSVPVAALGHVAGN